MRVARPLYLFDKKSLMPMLEQQYTHDEAVKIVADLRKLKMPSDFYTLIYEAMVSARPNNYGDKLACYMPMVTQRYQVLCQEKIESLEN